MVLEQIVSANGLQRNPSFAIVLGFVYTLLGTITGILFFRDRFSISLLFLITLLLVPSLMNLLSIEEEREKKEGFRRFFQNHRSVFLIYLFLSLGIFIGYLLIVWSSAFIGIDFNMSVGEQMKMLGSEITTSTVEEFNVNPFFHGFGIFSKNVGVALIFFILSFFYGAGAIFLIVWNASIFSTFVVLTINNLNKGVPHALSLLGIFSIYIVPEIAGFLLAAIAGGVISKAVMVESLFSESFKNVVKDAFILLLLAFGILLIAAFLESFVAVGLIKSLI